MIARAVGGQRVGAEGMVEDRGVAQQQEPQGSDREGRRRGMVAVEITCDRLERVFTIPARAVEVFIQSLGRGGLRGGGNKALGSHRLVWEVKRRGVGYRHRWTGTETFPRDGKQKLGLGDCKVHTGAQHIAC
jgi:hypothetical protein